MSEPTETPRKAIYRVIVWSIAAPILAIWTLLSLLPMVSVLRAWGSVGEVLVALGFLATGAFGLIAGAIAYRLLLWDSTTLSLPTAESRALRVFVLSAYALVWMALYAAW